MWCRAGSDGVACWFRSADVLVDGADVLVDGADVLVERLDVLVDIWSGDFFAVSSGDVLNDNSRSSCTLYLKFIHKLHLHISIHG